MMPEARPFSRIRRLARGLSSPYRKIVEQRAEMVRLRAELDDRIEAQRYVNAMLEQTQAALKHTQTVLAETRSALRATARNALFETDAPSEARDDAAPEAEGERHPSVLLIALPKSAGSYINTTLLKGLGYDHLDLSFGIYPNDVIDYAYLPAFKEGNKVVHNHLDPSAPNRWYLKTSGIRAVVHTRDPRGALLSWIHHIAPATAPEQLLPHHVIAPPRAYFERDLAWKIDWMIDHHLDRLVAWIEGWVALEAELADQLAFTQYERFVQDPNETFERILDHAGVPRARFSMPDLPRTREVNFREGRAEAWRDAFSPEQQRRARARLPDALAARFGWPD